MTTQNLYNELNTLRFKEERCQKMAMKWRQKLEKTKNEKRVESLKFLQERSRKAKKSIDQLMNNLGMTRDRRAVITPKSDGRVTKIQTMTRRLLQSLIKDYERVLAKSKGLGTGGTTRIRKLFTDSGERITKIEQLISTH